jgi:hypothetical protein
VISNIISISVNLISERIPLSGENYIARIIAGHWHEITPIG